MIPDHLRLQPGQEGLSPEQEREAERFAQARIATQLSTEPVDEPETEALLQQVYQVAGLPPPEHICWLDGPLQLVKALAPPRVDERLEASTRTQVTAHLQGSVQAGILAGVRASVQASVQEGVRERVWTTLWAGVRARVQASVWAKVWADVQSSVWDSVIAYEAASRLALYRFLDAYLAPNDLHALAHFNELVSGYWLGREKALLVRRPRLLVRDGQGRLHNATGQAIEYHDGWGFSAWHGVRVPEQVILSPERLSRQDYLQEENVEVRRVIQERMGERFVSELGGVVLDNSPRGTLYEVVLPDDPERVARYVQVQDASSERQYVLRVPPTIQTAAEAVAWTFQVAEQDYRPAQET